MRYTLSSKPPVKIAIKNSVNIGSAKKEKMKNTILPIKKKYKKRRSVFVI